MAVLPVGSVAGAPFTAPTLAPRAPAAGFGEMLASGLQQVSASQQQASDAAGLLATGRLENIHDFTAAASKASLAVSLTVALRNRAVEAYQEIMRMQL